MNPQDGKPTKPSDLMKELHPDLFTDSVDNDDPVISKLQFEYHLETLTSRNEERLFEYFCRALLEVEVCPNLLPQTGPTGGGDAKTDSENYPVAEDIASAWYIGNPTRSSTEKWAFAFSAQKTWRPKALSDIRKIAATNRGFTTAFFVTNQFVPDRERAALEDLLRAETKMEVKVFDRNWVVARVIDNRRIDLAIRTLQIEDVVRKSSKAEGPEDYRRRQELEELENQIKDPRRYLGVGFQLIEDCLQAAILARGLGLPRTDVDGRFLRATRLAFSKGTARLKLRASYQHAWTTFYWFDDAKEFARQFAEIIKIDPFSDAADVELISNLYMTLKGGVQSGLLTKEEAKLDDRRTDFLRLVSDVEEQRHRPSNALWAKFLRIKNSTQEDHAEGKPIDDRVETLIQIIHDGERYLDFPVLMTLKVIKVFEPILESSPHYDQLFDKVLSITSERTSEHEAGKLLLNRGKSLLEKQKPYEAIRFLGRAQSYFAKEESFAYLIQTMMLLGVAYDQVDLFWAARTYFLGATERLTLKFWRENDLDKIVLYSLSRLISVELTLGRVPMALTWMELLNVLEGMSNLSPDLLEEYNWDRVVHDATLGIHLLHAQKDELSEISFMPRVCKRLGLPAAQSAAWFTIGGVESLRTEKLMSETESDEAIETLFRNMNSQPVKQQIKVFADFNLKSSATLASNLFGCKVQVQTENNPESIVLAEMILGVIENLFATSLGANVFPYKGNFKIDIATSSKDDAIPSFELRNVEGEDMIAVTFNPVFFNQPNDLDTRIKFKKWIMDLALMTITQFAVISEVEAYLKKLVEEELAFDRATLFSDIWIALDNLLGSQKRFSIRDWKPKEEFTENKVTRIVSWISTQNPNASDKSPLTNPSVETETPSKDMFDFEMVKHHEIKTSDIVDIPTWDKARWNAVGFILFEEYPPIFCVGFKNIEAGEKIFKRWRNKFGKVDESNAIDISLITGIYESHPNSYGVAIGARLVNLSETNQRGYSVLRMNHMKPITAANLTAFLRIYKKVGCYWVLPCELQKLRDVDVNRAIQEFGILKKELNVTDAWKIGENDPLISILDEDEMPVVPEGIKDPPVLKAIEQLKAMKRSKGK